MAESDNPPLLPLQRPPFGDPATHKAHLRIYNVLGVHGMFATEDRAIGKVRLVGPQVRATSELWRRGGGTLGGAHRKAFQRPHVSLIAITSN
jgi:hypothetical protein